MTGKFSKVYTVTSCWKACKGFDELVHGNSTCNMDFDALRGEEGLMG